MRRASLLVPLVASAAWLIAPSAFAQGAPKRAAPAPAPLPPAPEPPPPPPYTSAGPTPTSTSGTSLMPLASPPLAPSAPAPVAAPGPDALTTDNRFKMIEARLAADEQAAKEGPALPAWLRGLTISGYVQPQLLVQSYNDAASPNANAAGALPAGVTANDVIARANGSTSNGTYFRLRRARLKTEYMPSESARLVFEIDPTPPNGAVGAPVGTGTIARQIEAQGIARFTESLVTELGVGMFKLPFGYEVLQSDADRPFIERSWGEQNMMPGEFDVGAKMYTTWTRGKWRLDVQLAMVNGQTVGEPTFALLPDLNKGKDFVGRAALDGRWGTLGVSGYYGQGQSVDAGALRFKQFVRGAVNVEAALRFSLAKSRADEWQTRLLGEITFAQNMDRGVKYAFAVPAIPPTIGSDVKDLGERNAWVRLEQDLTRWVTLGVRWDEYAPDVSQSDDARDTFGGVLVVHFTKGLQAMLEADYAVDHVHAAGAAAPDRKITSGSGVLQARF